MELGDAALAQSYEDSSAAGRKFIEEYWRSFRQSTRDWLISSRHYDAHGQSQPLEYGNCLNEIESLEYDLGVLQRCVNAKLPTRQQVGAMVSSDALSDAVLSTASQMTYGQRGREPQFLRLALQSVRTHQIATLLTRLPAITNPRYPSLKLFRVVVTGGLLVLGVIASPAMLAGALASAAKGDAASAMIGLYGIGFVLLLAGDIKVLAKDKAPSPDELAYEGWFQLNPFGVGPWLDYGAGARAYLENMMRKGATVPPVAVDLCALLSQQVTAMQVEQNK